MKRPKNSYPDRTTAFAAAINSTVLLQPAAPSAVESANTVWLNPDRQEFVFHPDNRTMEQRSYTHNYRLVSRIK